MEPLEGLHGGTALGVVRHDGRDPPLVGNLKRGPVEPPEVAYRDVADPLAPSVGALVAALAVDQALHEAVEVGVLEHAAGIQGLPVPGERENKLLLRPEPDAVVSSVLTEYPRRMLGEQALRQHAVTDEVGCEEALVVVTEKRAQPRHLTGRPREEGLAPRAQRAGDVAVDVVHIALGVF